MCMTLTLSDGPLTSTGPADVNYAIDGPRHRILFGTFPRRVRAVLDGKVVVDTRRGRLLHESNLLPALYVPIDDVDTSLLQRTDHTTHCPFKGDASYWSIVTDDRTAENAVWGYEEPMEGAEWLADHVAFYWDRLDAWFDEDEQVHGHLRDPYHRVDVRRSSAHVVVRRGDEVLAESRRPMIVSETGLPNRWYLPMADVSAPLASSTTTTHCPYKGDSTYYGLPDQPDVAWGYHEPHDDTTRIAGHVCFLADGITTDVDGQPA